VLGEVVVLWLITLAAIRLVVDVFSGTSAELMLALVPILFIYTPVWLCKIRGVHPDLYPIALPPFRDPEWGESFRLAAVVIAVVFIPWIIGYHLYQTLLVPELVGMACDLGVRQACALPVAEPWPAWRLPSEPARLVAYHVFFVALPEEFFYRGYLQTRLDEAFGVKWRLLGADVGWGWVITCLIFAFGHSIVVVQWWHFAIFFPSLVFGWMRARTGGVVAGALFHAFCNVAVNFLDTAYGIVPP